MNQSLEQLEKLLAMNAEAFKRMRYVIAPGVGLVIVDRDDVEMHGQVMDFLREMKVRFPQAFRGKVLECGSLRINGSPRFLFETKDYTGIDAIPGVGVDVVGLVHTVPWDDGTFDTVISTEMLEHDPYWEDSVRRMVALVKTGGSLIITYAGYERQVHEAWASPEPGYYFSPPVRPLVNLIWESGFFKDVVIRVRDDPSDVHICMVGKQ